MTSNDYESVKQQLAAVNPHSSRAEMEDAGYDLQFDMLNRAEWALACSKAMPHSRMHEGVIPYAQPIDLKPLQQQLGKIVVPFG